MINLISTTAGDPYPKSGFPANDSSGFDPYTDLFAALFSFPGAVPPAQPVKAELQSEKGAETTDLFLSQEGPKTALLPTAKPFSDSDCVADILGLFPGRGDSKAKVTKVNPGVDPIDPTGIEKPVRYLGPPIDANPGKVLETPSVGPNDRLPVVPEDVCGMPVDGKTPPLTGRMPKETIIQHVEGKVDRPKDEHDHPIEFEILEIPADLTPQVTKSDNDTILEVPPSATSSEPVQTDELMMTAAAAGTIGTPKPLPVEPLPKIWTSSSREPKVDKKSDTSLLETFTNNVIADSAPADTVRSSATNKSLWEGAETFAELSKPLEEKPQGELATEFSFDSSLSGGSVVGRTENSYLSDVKAKRMILDQVGSNLTDLAQLQKDGGDNRVLKIRLKPAELGTVEITLSKNANGVIDAHFRTDNPHTQHLLSETLAQLRDSLESSGMKVGHLETSCSTSFSGSHDGGGKERQTFVTPDDRQLTTPQFNGIIKGSDDSKQNRLVNLRA
ncbi:MAG: flagellar hook-length control protein FliK [Pyrinomonadaceae bacterium]